MWKLSARYIPPVLFFVLLAVFPVIGKTIDDLRRSSTKLVITHLNDEAAKIQQPRTGEELIPADALSAIYLLRESGVEEFAVSSGLRNTYAYQRITEGAWPIRLVSSAPARLYLSNEVLPDACSRKDDRDGMVLALCR